MAGETISPNMGLVIPAPAVTFGPQWATDLNASLSSVDQHNHSPGQGVQVTPNGLDINTDLPFNGNNATQLKSTRFTSQLTPLSGASDLGCLYESGVDLYYNDGSGNQIRITQSGGVAGTPGSITNLTPPASATYVSATQTFVWQSAANTPANLDCESVIFRNFVASSKGLTVSAPAAMAADYNITLPPLPVSQKFMTIDNLGTILAPWQCDGTTIAINSNQLVVQAAGLISGPGLTTNGNTITLAAGVISAIRFEANGLYSGASSFPQTFIDGVYVFPYNASITSVWIYNLTPGVSGTTEFSLTIMQNTGGGGTINAFSTTGKITSAAGSNVWTDSNAVIGPQAGVTKPVIATSGILAGWAIRFNLEQSMSSPAANCGMIVNFVAG